MDYKNFLMGYLNGRMIACQRAVQSAVETAKQYLYGTPSESGNIGLRVGDTVTYYDGAVLPELPEWDKTVYPFAYLCTQGIHYLNLSTVPFKREVGTTGYQNMIPDTNGSVIEYKKASNDTEWVRNSDGDRDVTPYNGINHWPFVDIYWANFDIQNTDGTTHVTATEPIPVSLVGNSYNGTVLPVAPETDLAYAVLTHHEAFHSEGWGQVIDEPERYQLSVLAEPFYAETLTNGTTYIRSNPYGKYQRWVSYAPDFSKWELAAEGEELWVVSYDDVLWTNHNVFFGELANTVEENVVYTDELFMAESSAPIPVYERSDFI